MHPPPSPARNDFTLITECTPESSGCNSVYSVVPMIAEKASLVYILNRGRILGRNMGNSQIVLSNGTPPPPPAKVV